MARKDSVGYEVSGGRTLEDLSVEYPRDCLALQAGHAIPAGAALTLS